MMDTYQGHVRTPADAIKLFEACRLGLLPRVQRRLSEKERQTIKSGSVFVWDEREAGMRRWTDGKSWSASRVSGSFLTYREMEGKRGGGSFAQAPVRRTGGKTPESGRGSDEDQEMDGEGPDGYRYKLDGLMKQSFSITTSTGQHLHLISYYSRPHPNVPEIAQPTTDPALRHIVPVKGMYPESTVHESQGPAVTRAPMQQSPYMQPPPPQHLQVSPGHRGQPYPYQVSPGYAWPPSPMSTPPFPQYQGPMYNSALPGPPGSAHTSPYQQHSPHGMPQHPMSQPQHQQPTAFDRPPHISDPSLPPPQLRGIGMSSATAAQPQVHPQYARNPSPGMSQVVLVAQQAQIAQGALQAARMIDPRLTGEQPLPPVQIHGEARPSTPPQAKSTSPAHTPNSTHARPVSRESSPKVSGASGVNGTSQAQIIPSISALVHSTNSVSVMSDNKSNSSRSGSKSPRQEAASREAEVEKPKDIPHGKLNILGEDQRAKRVLDRKFCI
ncbi:Gti1/Pac2 family-domain-containing protein [Amylocarpus encephaloides]|uniref:Gti1/Pac2 family-domain-containing protein n=1 Tax=Amylocarpus encephaloides TaxID=45428 RepID=A0A9P7YKP1_9HELO|nr:Gti1/Pac2 family-domain-containing protein [Amylocarpus encephaloides]